MKSNVKLLSEILQNQLAAPAWEWLEESCREISGEKGADRLNRTFPQVPRKTGKAILAIDPGQEQQFQQDNPGASISDWTVDRLARVWILLQINSADKNLYVQKIERLFLTAEMNELVALYSALPYPDYPESWLHRCTEGIRNNIGTVLEAVMYANPYPAQWLPEPAWNQLVLKAFFTDKNVDRITGLDNRANQALADILIDYAHERWQAHRKVNPQLWRLVGKFINSNTFSDLQKLYREGDPLEKKAAILACSQSAFAPAQQLAAEAAGGSKILETLSWQSLIKESLQISNN